MYLIFFTHSSSDGQVGCFPLLTIVSSVVMNIGVHVSFWIIMVSRFAQEWDCYVLW